MCLFTVIALVGLKECQAWSISSRDLLDFFFFFAHKHLIDELWQLVEVQIKPQTHIRIRLKVTWQQMGIRLLHTDRRESLSLCCLLTFLYTVHSLRLSGNSGEFH